MFLLNCGLNPGIIAFAGDVGNWKSDQAPFRQHRFEALLNRSDELFGNRPAVDLIDELEVAFLHGLDVAAHASILSGTARLFLVCVVEFRLA